MTTDLLVSIVIPILNEEDNIPVIVEKLQDILKQSIRYEIIFVDDGSSDATLTAVKAFNENDKRIKYISFSRNFGHQNALKAGLDYAQGDGVITMDGDLQHPPELIPQLIEKWQEGYDVITTIRKENPKASILKKLSSWGFYKVVNSLSDIQIKQGSADFRLLDRSVVEVIRHLQESPLFIRGLISWLGFKQYGIEYIPQDRLSGKTKYSMIKMFQFASFGITSFSVKPLYFSAKIGAVIAMLSFCYGLYALYIRLFTNIAIEGWASLLIVMSFIGGIQLLMMGILGEYLGKLFMAQKQRPNYIIRELSDDLKRH